MIRAAGELNPIEQEGYVVVDADFNRLKIKSPAYVAIHHIKDNFTHRRILELLKLGEAPEVLSYYPEYMEQFKSMEITLNSFIDLVQKDYEDVIAEVGVDAVQKDFALKALTKRLPAALFALRSGRAQTAREFVMSMDARKLEELLP